MVVCWFVVVDEARERGVRWGRLEGETGLTEAKKR